VPKDQQWQLELVALWELELVLVVLVALWLLELVLVVLWQLVLKLVLGLLVVKPVKVVACWSLELKLELELALKLDLELGLELRQEPQLLLKLEVLPAFSEDHSALLFCQK